MPPFPKPTFTYDYDVTVQVNALRAHRAARKVPAKSPGKLLVLTWNIANLGQQERTDADLTLIAEVMSWFDVIAVQECKENFGHLFDLVHKLGANYRVVCSDASGNNERLAFLYNTKKLKPLEEIGEVAFPVSQYKHVKIKGNSAKFDGFDRTPYLVSFQAGKTSIVFVNVHLFFGSERKRSDIDRRALETFAVARWANLRSKSAFAFTRELVALGDFNMPMSEHGDAIFDALTKLGLEVPQHSTQVASSVMSDAHYDQIAFFPGTTKACFTGKKGVFDYDQVVFADLYKDGKGKNLSDFKSYCRYHLSDHRPMWVELGV